MKSLIAAAVLAVALPCTAGVLFTAPTNAGGVISLTDEKGTCPGATNKATNTRDGKPGTSPVDGCWKQLDAETVMVFWPEVGIYFYPVEAFTKVSAKGWL